MITAMTRGWRSLALCGLLAVLMAGCGGDDDPGPEPTPDCAISDVTTGLDTSFLTGDVVDINWDQNGVPGTVRIELLKGGLVVDTIATSSPNDGFHAWIASTGGQSNGSDFGIRVSGTGEPSCRDEITGLTIIDVTGCTLAFTAVVDTITAGEDFTITWDSASTSGAVDIELYKSMPNSLGDFVGTIAFGAPDDGSFTWTTDSFHVGTLFYRYRIVDALVAGCDVISPGFVMIDEDLCIIDVFGPNEDQEFTEGEVMSLDIDQSPNNGSGRVNLRLYSGNMFVPGGFVADNLAVPDGMLDWEVNDFDWGLTNTNYRIRAFDASDSYCVGESNRFTIIGN
jgi:hypothetical protein